MEISTILILTVLLQRAGIPKTIKPTTLMKTELHIKVGWWKKLLSGFQT